MEVHKPKTDRWNHFGLVWKWILATLAGTILAVALLALVYTYLPGLWGASAMEGGFMEDVHSIVVPLVAGSMFGLGLSLLQGAVFQRQMFDIGYGAWIGVSVLGFALTILAIARVILYLDQEGFARGLEAMEDLTEMFITGVMLGLIPGLAQWLILRRFGQRSILWIVVSPLAWGIGVAAGSKVFMMLIDAGMNVLDEGVQIVMVLILVSVIGIIVGILTGLVLPMIIRSTQPIPVID